MKSMLQRFWDWLVGVFWSTEMDVTIVGLQNAGKTSLVRVLAVSPPRAPRLRVLSSKLTVSREESLPSSASAPSLSEWKR